MRSYLKAVALNLVQLYRVFYGREPLYDTEYLPNLRALRGGSATPASLAAQLVAQTGIVSTAQLIATMCAKVNPMAPPSTISNCVNGSANLAALNPSAAAVQFVQSAAYQGVNSAQRDAVYLMYTITLNRPPDQSGFDYWLGVMTANNFDIYWLVT